MTNNNKTKQTKSKINNKQEVVEETTEQAVPAGDLFALRTGGLFTEKDIFEMDLPKFILKNSLKNIQSISEKSSITFVFIADQTNPDIGKRIFKAIKEGFKEFKLLFPDNSGNLASVWNFSGIRIKAIDFGTLQKVREEQPRTVTCELEYDHLAIDDEIIS